MHNPCESVREEEDIVDTPEGRQCTSVYELVVIEI